MICNSMWVFCDHMQGATTCTTGWRAKFGKEEEAMEVDAFTSTVELCLKQKKGRAKLLKIFKVSTGI